MKSNVENMLRQAGKLIASPTHGDYYRYSMAELVKNMRELRDRTKAGDMRAVAEFFSVYVFDGD